MNTGTLNLTIAEMGKLWASYTGNSMGKRVLSYYLKHVEDQDIKDILEYCLGLSDSLLQEITAFLTQGNFPIPVGFRKDDVNLDAPRMFKDDFYLPYLMYLGKAGMSIYSVAIPLVTHEVIRDFFVRALEATVKFLVKVTEIALAKGVMINAPVLPAPKSVDFVTRQSFLNAFWGEKRPLHGLEISHLYGNINNDITSKALIIGFAQGTNNDKVRQYLERGAQLNHKHIEKMSEKLTEEHLPAPSLLDHLVTSSTISPFSDRLIMQHKIDMFSMKIREYANGSSLDGRKDIGALYAKLQLDVSLYVEDGANIMIEQGWMEQPPEAIDREQLLQK